jgi:hypothetical protein
MRALSLWQPWASAMAIGLKSIETRHWRTNVRGLVAIHAAKRWTADERDFAADMADEFDERLRIPPLGAVVATGFIENCLPTEQLRGIISETERAFGNYGNGRFGFVMRDIRPLAQPFPWKGAQGFFEIDADIFGDAPAAAAIPVPVTRPTPVQGSLL